jgi:hypothetical protein
MKEVKIKAVEIKWDTESERELEQLPVEMEIPEHLKDIDEISDYISEKTGFCHGGFRLIQKKSDEVISYNVDDNSTLHIYLGNAILATVEDGREDEDFVEDILYDMGYIWYEDGKVWETIVPEN